MRTVSGARSQNGLKMSKQDQYSVFGTLPRKIQRIKKKKPPILAQIKALNQENDLI